MFVAIKTESKYKILVGKFYMRSGNVIPFAAVRGGEYEGFKFSTELDEEKGNRITRVISETFISFDGIPEVNFLDYSNIEVVVTDSEYPMSDELMTKYGLS